MNLKDYIKEFPGFPHPGINFKDISPILKSYKALEYIAKEVDRHFSAKNYDLIAGIESRGLIFASAMAGILQKGCVMIRKKGKLPGNTVSMSYTLEYGSNILEMQNDAIDVGQKVLVVDDLLATGGTAKCACDLVERLGGEVVGCAFVIELLYLGGRKLIDNYEVETLVKYE